MIIPITILTFGAVLALFLSIHEYMNKSVIAEKLRVGEKMDITPFWETVWEFSKSGIEQEEIFRYAVIFSAIGLGIGLFLKQLLFGIILGVAGFVLAPRLIARLKKNRFEKQFNAYYARAISSFSVASKVMPLSHCFKHIAQEFKPPISTVFGYIDTAITDFGLPMHVAILNAANEYELEALHGFAESVQVLDEMGGGSQATNLLLALAEEARYQHRHSLETKGLFGELQLSMALSSLIPVGMFGIFLMDKNSGFSNIVKQYPVIIISGVVVLALGWGISKHLISKAASTS